MKILHHHSNNPKIQRERVGQIVVNLCHWCKHCCPEETLHLPNLVKSIEHTKLFTNGIVYQKNSRFGRLTSIAVRWKLIGYGVAVVYRIKTFSIWWSNQFLKVENQQFSRVSLLELIGKIIYTDR